MHSSSFKSSYCSTPLSGSRGRKIQMAQMIILPTIPISILIIQQLIALWTTLEYQKEVADIDRQVLKIGTFCYSEILKQTSVIREENPVILCKNDYLVNSFLCVLISRLNLHWILEDWSLKFKTNDQKCHFSSSQTTTTTG